ncbi:MAG TPA: ATP-binding protein [Myxococcales bacterium]|nr:ATP-binding protein [Myxococcales bacterium]
MAEQGVEQESAEAFDGPVGALMRAHDWSRSVLGPIEGWPCSLRSYVTMILRLPTPAIIFWGTDQIQLYNDGYATIMGPRHPKYLAAPYRDCWPDTYPTIHPWMERVLAGEVIEVEDTLFTLTRHGFNEEAYFTFSFSPLRDDHGEIAGVLQPVVEVTGRVLGERRVRTLRALAPAAEPGVEAVRRVCEALDANAYDVPFSLLYLDGEAGLALAARSGIGAGQVPAAVPDAAARAFAGNAAVAIEAPAAVLGAVHVGPWDEPTRSAIALPVRRGDADAPLGAIVLGISPRLRFDDSYREFFEAIAREVAANLAAEQARLARLDAERVRRDLEEFFMQTPAPLAILTGPEHRFALSNRSYVDLVGVEVEGKRVVDMYGSAEVVAPFLPILDRVYRSGEPFVGREMPFRRPRKDGGADDLLLNLSYTPVRRRDGVVTGVLVFAYDITREVAARRHAESLASKLETAVRARDEFLGIASHELRTPLTALKLQLQLGRRALARADAPGRATPALLDALLKQADRLSRLVEDMLDISRIHAGKLVLEVAPADLSELVSDVVGRFRSQLEAVGSPVRLDLAPGLGGEWDVYRVEQAITNVVTNAIRHAPGTAIEVSTERSGDRAVLVVRDHGPGIAPPDRERIFMRFERAAGKDVSGLGLGLFIAREILEGHGGSIRADEAAGGGARFVIELPLAKLAA